MLGRRLGQGDMSAPRTLGEGKDIDIAMSASISTASELAAKRSLRRKPSATER